MSFWKNLLGISKKETQIIKEPEHDLAQAPPDDLMVIKDETESAPAENAAENTEQKDQSNIIKDKEDNFNNKDSP